MKRFLAVLLLVVTMLGTFTMPAAAYTYPMEYTITYKSTDGTVLGTKKGSVDAAADVRNALSIPSPSYTGYSLQNAKDATVTGSMITWNFPASNYIRHGTGGYTVYYVKNIQVTIYYIYGGSKRVAAPPKTITGAPSATYSVTSPSVTGYTPDKKTVYDAYKNGNKYVYYYENVYTISFNANGGSGAPASITKSHFLDSSVKLPTTKPTRTGYNFLGWSTSSTATSATYSAGGSYSSNGNVTLYAVWAKKTYTISYNANGGSGAPSSQTKTHDTDIRISSTKPTRTGYDFLGWGLSSTTSTVSYSAGDRYATNASRTLYAVWSAKKYTVSYNANGGSGAPSSQTKTYNVGLTLSSTVPTRNGYTFKGWSTSSTATSATYTAGETYSTNASATLYAVWSCNHSSTTKKWIDGCNWKIVCDTCGVTIRTGTTHGPYSYSAWTYYSTTQHKRTKSCDHGDYSETEYGSHSTSTKYEQYSSTQHKYYSYCATCDHSVGSVSYGNHTYVDTTSNGVITHKCSMCGYSYTSKVTYTVSFNANGGSGAPSAQTKTHGTTLTLSSTKPTRSGYTFKGWATSSSATSATYLAGGSYTGNSSVTLYAVWSCNHSSTNKVNDTACNWHTVCNTCGATISSGTTHGATVYGTWTYYTETQHRRTQSCEHGDYSTYEYGNHSTTIKYEQYTATQHKKYSYCSTCSSKVGSDTIENHTFTTSTVNGQVISVCSQCGYTTSKAATYTVSYNANGGSGAPSAQTKTHGVTMTISVTKPTRTGYTFIGWATSSTATGATYSAGGNYTNNANATLYAVWSCNHSSTKKVNDTACNWHTVCNTCGATLSSGTTHTGNTYSAWTYYNQNQHKRTKSCEHGDYSTTEYASHSTVIKYDKYSTSQHKVYSYCSTCSSVIGDVSYASHNFTSSVSNGKRTYTCKDCGYSYSESVTYSVSFNANGGSGAPSSQIKTHGVVLTLSGTKPTRTGYDFLGWATSSTATTAAYSAGGSFTGNSDTTLYAVWIKTTYSIKFDANGGSGAPISQTKTYGITLTLSSVKPTRFNYDFLGWSTSQAATNATYTAGGSYTANSGATLYAVWKYNPAKYTVSYNANGGSGAPSSQTKTYGVTLTLSSTKPTRFNYDFKGWATSSTATSAAYNAGDAYTANEGATLYAVWVYNPAKYTVTFNANGGSNPPASQTKVYGEALTITTAVPEREGYNCVGWATSSTAMTAEYAPGASYTINSATTLYAVWKLKTYMITFNANGGSGAPNPVTKTHGQAVSLVATTPSRSGYKFLGWSTDKNAEQPEYKSTDKYSDNGDVTLYAIWASSNYEFRVGNLTVDKTEVDQYAKITVKFNAYCDDNRLFFYSVPVEVLCDGKSVMTKTVEISGGSQLVIGFDMTVGEVIGNHTLEARINWNERSKETNPNNNTATCSFKVNQLIETSTSVITVNGEYYTGSEVISSFYISNGSSYDILPSNAVNYDFKVYYFDNGAEKVVNTQTWKNVVIPANGTNLVYFKWTVLSDNAGITYYVRGSINAAKATTEADSTNNTVEFTVVSKEKVSSQIPNTRYEKNAPTSYNANASAPSVTAGSATWNMWVYENNALVLKSYGITVTSENPTVSPSSECSTASKVGTVWNMKSGYGISVSWNPKLVSISGTVMPGSDAYTNPQNVVAAFPEYNYSFETGKCRTLENVSGTFMLVQNADADGNERIHFIPVYVKNGNYNVSVTASGIWTPAGMITAVRNANAININGTIYDDWYSGV